MVARRGLVWEKNVDFSKSRLFVPTSKGVFAINAESGEILKEFGNQGQVGNQLSLIAPIITKNSIIIALIKPSVEAYVIRSKS
jgi:quinoprotein glucose dehydrogenase